MKKILLAGNAVTAEILSAYLKRDARYEIVGLTVDDEYVEQAGMAGARAVGMSVVTKAFAPDQHSVIMAVGYGDLNRSREYLFGRLKAMGYGMETYIHPDARVYTEHTVGEGSVILPGAVVEPHARVGVNTMVWSNVTLAHHSAVGDHCWIAAGSVVSGQAKVERNCFLGVNCTVVNSITVGEFNVIGAGALISRNTKARSVYLARSAEPVRFSADDYVKHFGI